MHDARLLKLARRNALLDVFRALRRRQRVSNNDVGASYDAPCSRRTWSLALPDEQAEQRMSLVKLQMQPEHSCSGRHRPTV